MNRETIPFNPIGMIRSEHVVARQTPIQPVYAKGCKGRVEIFPEFAEGLRDLDGFSHIYLIFHFNQAGPVQLIVKPFLQDCARGVFSTGWKPPAMGGRIRLTRKRRNTLAGESISEPKALIQGGNVIRPATAHSPPAFSFAKYSCPLACLGITVALTRGETTFLLHFRHTCVVLVWQRPVGYRENVAKTIATANR